MYPELFKLGPVTVYTYGVLLAAAYLLGLRLAMSRAQERAGSIRTARSTSASPSSSPRWSARSCCSSSSTSIASGGIPPSCSRSSARRRVLRRPDRRRGGRVLVHAAAQAAAVDDVRCLRARHRARPAVGRLGCLMAGCCYGRPTDVPWAITFTNPEAAANVGTPLGVAAAPDAAVRERARAADPRCSCWRPRRRGGRSRAARSGATCSSTRISRFVIEFFRGDERGVVFGAVSTSPVHLARAGAAGHRHACRTSRAVRPDPLRRGRARRRGAAS